MPGPLNKRVLLQPVSSCLKAGFTLIEMAIVLVIIGFVVGGILVGQDMINNATLRSEVSQFEKWAAAVNSYKLKYNALPGDDPNAASLGLGVSGNGDGIIQMFHGSIPSPYEGINVWIHLQSAGLINGGFTQGSCTAGIGYPLSKLNAYSISGASGYALFTADYSGFDTNNGSYPYLGDGNLWVAMLSACSGGERGGISPLQLKLLDTKFDDGLPFTGKIRLMGQDGIYDDTSFQIMCSPGHNCTYPTSATCATGTVASGGSYAITTTGGNCPLAYRLQ